jgi:O-antigen/teichoic acid export membrane protein
MLKDSLRYGAGILPHHLVTVLAPLISKGLLNYKGSLVALGVFSLASRFLQPLDLLYSTFVTSFGPVYFSLRNEENMEKIKSVYSAVWILAVIFFVTTVSIFPYLILLITPERFHQSAQLIPILAWGFLGRVLYYFFLVENYFDKNTSRVSMVTGVGLIVNLSVTLIAIDKYEVYAVASASALGFLSQAAAGFIISKKHFLNYIKPSQIVSGLIISLTVFVLVLNIPVDALFSRLIIVLVALGLLTLANLRSLKGIYSAL